MKQTFALRLAQLFLLAGLIISVLVGTVWVARFIWPQSSAAANGKVEIVMPLTHIQAVASPTTPNATATPTSAGTRTPLSPASYTPNWVFTLRTGIAEGRLVYIGVGGALEGEYNPALRVNPNDIVQINLINGDGAEHDITIPDYQVMSDHVVGKGASTSIVFRADKEGAFPYFCSLPGHRAAGMEGRLIVGEVQRPTPVAASISRDPTDLPGPIGDRPSQQLRVDLVTTEIEGHLADGVSYTYWTFNGQVPGPFIRVRVGDTVELHLRNDASSHMIHSIDLHAVTGPGGGAAVMQVPPGQERFFTFKALKPGVYVYHCATPMVAQHIANGMYGLILVEPEGGLPKVDHEFYVMQGEIYTQQPYGQHGHGEFSIDKLLAERPEYVVFNGAVGSLTTDHPLKARVGETVRIFFGDGGPNLTSSFHVIGEIFDRVFNLASLTSAPLTDVQTTLVPPGGATVVEFKLDVPGRYLLVDHALGRMEHGLVGFLLAEGPENLEIFRSESPANDSSGH